MNIKTLTRTTALGLALAALAAPAAGAQQDLRNADQVTPQVQAQQDLRNPDEVAPPVDAPQDLRSPDTIDAAAGRGTDRSPDVVFVKVPADAPTAAPADGLDWQDAAIGAGSLFAIGLIGLGATLLVVHRRHSSAAATAVR